MISPEIQPTQTHETLQSNPVSSEFESSRFEELRERVTKNVGELALRGASNAGIILEKGLKKSKDIAAESGQRNLHRAKQLQLSGSSLLQKAKSGYSKLRMNHSAKIMEKMDHKEALYSHLDQQAVFEQREGGNLVAVPDTGIVHRDPSGNPPGTRSYIERFIDKRIHKRVSEAKSAYVDHWSDKQDHTGGTGYESKLARYSRERNVKRKTKINGRKERLTARDQNTRINEGAVNTRRPESRTQTKNRELAEETRNKLVKTINRTVRQPLLHRWRVGSDSKRTGYTEQGRQVLIADQDIVSRRGRAIGRIKKNHYRIEDSKNKRLQIKAERDAQRKAETARRNSRKS